MALLEQLPETPNDKPTTKLAGMGEIYVHGAPGLPGCALDSPASGAIYNAVSNNGKEESLKRSYTTYASDDHTSLSQVSMSNGTLFNPDEHLVHRPPQRVYTMTDLGLPANNGVSHVAVSEPFPLFSEIAVDMMRAEVLADVVMDHYSYTSDIAPKQIRGYAPRHAKFITEAWKSQRTLEIISRIAGIDLVPVIDYEIGHINISIPGALKKDKDGLTIPEENNKAVVSWHRDSYPFVCVLMMSDTTGMVGGETALKTGTGGVMKVRGPTKGCAVVLQGRYIEHQALRAFGSQERITMVTSFRPRSPMVRDDTVLNTVRPVSHLPDLYGQVVEYQLENMEARLRRYLKAVRESMKVDKFDVKAFKEWVAFEKHALDYISKEIVEENMVKKGIIMDAIEADRAELAALAARAASTACTPVVKADLV